MGKIIMGYWDCPVCGTKEIRGDVVSCPSCGRARGDVKFYMKGHTEDQIRGENERGDLEYVDEEKAKYISRNPDWYCSFCESLNSDNAEYCSSCGATRADSEANYFDRLKKKQEQEAAEAAARPQATAPQRKKGKSPLLILAVIALAVIGLIVWMNKSKTSGDLSVSALRWDRVIHVEEYVSGSGWTLPYGADLTDQRLETRMETETRYRSEEVQRTRRVIERYVTKYGTRDLGNGYYEEYSWEEPVYGTETYWETVQVPYTVQVPRQRTKYYYNIWQINYNLDLHSSGTTHDTSWPEVDLPEGRREAESNSREGLYRFSVTDPKTGKTEYYSLAESDWMNLNPGDTVRITRKNSGANPYLSDEKGGKIADLRSAERFE